MMKTCLLICAVLAAALDGSLLTPALHPYSAPLAVAALILTVVAALCALLAPAKAAPKPAPVPPLQPAPVTAQNQAEAEIAGFFALLQEKGRFIDFLMDDVAAYDDSQVGAAARVVHQGCRQVLREHFAIAPISDSAEGSQLTVPAGFAADEYRLLGKISGNPPFTGTLIHKGWKTISVKLPRIIATPGKLPVIAPAEVELK